MDSMLSAIRSKRGGAQAAPSSPAPSAQLPSDNDGDEAEDSGMQDLVASLSDDQKSELMELLQQDQSGGDGETPTDEINKGAPSSEEKGAISKQAMSDSGSGISQDDSDDIAASMTDRNAASRADQGARPVSLGDRVKMAMASKLKGKGKL